MTKTRLSPPWCRKCENSEHSEQKSGDPRETLRDPLQPFDPKVKNVKILKNSTTIRGPRGARRDPKQPLLVP